MSELSDTICAGGGKVADLSAFRAAATSPALHLEPECRACRWRFLDGCCHFAPPSHRLPYNKIGSWPTVPETGGGCSCFAAKGGVE